jgi:hypothetical protein
MQEQGQPQQQNEEQQRRRQQALANTFKRALDDPQFAQRWLDNPRAMSDRQQQDGATQQLPPVVLQLRRQLLQQVLDRAHADQQFHQELTQHPRQALWDAGFGPQLEQVRAEMPLQEEVRGFWWTPTGTYLFTGWQYGTLW